MMQTLFFIRFLNSSLILSAMLLMVIIVKHMLRKHLTIKFQHDIWYIVLFLLTIPFLPIDQSFYGNWFYFFSKSSNNTTAFSSVPPVAGLVNKSAENLRDFTSSVTRTVPEQLNLILTVIWILGMIAMAYLTFLSNRRIRNIKGTVKPIDDLKLEQLFHTFKRRLRIRRKIILGKSDLLSTPGTFGLFKPYIILPDQPETSVSHGDYPYVFLHELNHYKHGDLFLNVAVCIFQIIYWFNPLIWYALQEFRCDCEIACDNSVLKILNEKHRMRYGNAIINCAQNLQQPLLNVTSYMSGTKIQITKRIQQIALFSKDSKWVKIKTSTLFILIGTMIVTSIPFLSMTASGSEKYNLPYNTPVVYEDLSQYFNDFQGSFVLYDLNANQYTIYGKDRSRIRVSPDSTYKVYDSLIALETNIITKDQNTLEWSGTKYPYAVWNQNQNLSSALKNSVNWYFQELDKKIGQDILQNYFTRMDYGNCDLSGDISDYWLESSLKISPVEQVQLLKAFYTNELHFNKLNIDTVKSALVLSKQKEGSLSGKTGTGTVNQKNRNGWFIGYIESKGNTYFFATNIQNGTNPCGSEAAKITLSILNAKNIYRNQP